MDAEDLHFVAAGLNHFSCMLELKDRRNGRDLYPEVLEKAHDFFLHEVGYSDILDKYRETGIIEGGEKFDKDSVDIKSHYEWADRKLIKFMLENYNLLPITTDSHFGEYLSWAWDVVDHRGILDFYDWYKISLTTPMETKIELKTHERVVPIIEGLIQDLNYEESAVNLLNEGYIEDLPHGLPWKFPPWSANQG